MAQAEYALNSRAPPATLQEAAAALEALRRQDTAFFRAHVLGARLAIALRDEASARALLDVVLALNPNHTLARKLQAALGPAPTSPTP